MSKPKFILNKLLRDLPLSKRQLAKRMKVPYQSVFRLCRKGYNPTLKTMIEIAQAVPCKVCDLIEE